MKSTPRNGVTTKMEAISKYNGLTLDLLNEALRRVFMPSVFDGFIPCQGSTSIHGVVHRKRSGEEVKIEMDISETFHARNATDAVYNAIVKIAEACKSVQPCTR